MGVVNKLTFSVASNMSIPSGTSLEGLVGEGLAVGVVSSEYIIIPT